MTITEKGGYMIDETQLSKGEAIIFIQLLTCERERHKRESVIASIKWQHISTKEYLICHFWGSCIKRHEEDIVLINKTITYLEQKFNLEG